MDTGKVISAQVVLTSAAGTRPGPKSRITSENIRQWEPSVKAIEQVSAEFRGMGFTVGKCVGNSMSITGPARLFESCFHTKLREKGKGGVQFADGGDELPAAKIPSTLKPQVAAVTFSPPPDFGPGAATEALV